MRLVVKKKKVINRKRRTYELKNCMIPLLKRNKENQKRKRQQHDWERLNQQQLVGREELIKSEKWTNRWIV